MVLIFSRPCRSASSSNLEKMTFRLCTTFCGGAVETHPVKPTRSQKTTVASGKLSAEVEAASRREVSAKASVKGRPCAIAAGGQAKIRAESQRPTRGSAT